MAASYGIITGEDNTVTTVIRCHIFSIFQNGSTGRVNT
jgi:hypothetical protein